jgi:hypothetical protein
MAVVRGDAHERFVIGLGICLCYPLIISPEEEMERWKSSQGDFSLWKAEDERRSLEAMERRELGGRTASEIDQAFRDPLEQPDGSMVRPNMTESLLAKLQRGF